MFSHVIKKQDFFLLMVYVWIISKFQLPMLCLAKMSTVYLTDPVLWGSVKKLPL